MSSICLAAAYTSLFHPQWLASRRSIDTTSPSAKLTSIAFCAVMVGAAIYGILEALEISIPVEWSFPIRRRK